MTTPSDPMTSAHADSKVVRTWSADELKDHYRRAFGIDISRYIVDKTVKLIRNHETGVLIFEGCLPGDAEFYNSLSQSDWYYMRDRWEHAVAAERLLDAASMPKVLDVGCGDGDFLALLRQKGCPDLTGLEFNPNALAACEKRGLSVSNRTLLDVARSGERFDAVTAFQVLEHVPDPIEFIREIMAVTKPGGTIVLATPNRDTFTRRFEWDLLDMPPHHISRWNEAAYRAVARMLGLDVVAVAYEPVAPYHRGWYMSSYVQGVPLAFKLRAIASRIAAALPMPERFWRGRRGHTILVELRMPAGG